MIAFDGKVSVTAEDGAIFKGRVAAGPVKFRVPVEDLASVGKVQGTPDEKKMEEVFTTNREAFEQAAWRVFGDGGFTSPRDPKGRILVTAADVR
jgi:hypothetical protein